MRFFEMFMLLPDDIVICILIVWSSYQVLGRLDSACCNYCDRSQILRIIQHECLPFKVNKSCALCSGLANVSYRVKLNFLKWIFERQVSLSQLSVTPELVRDGTSLIYNVSLVSVRSLTISDFAVDFDKDVDFTSIINSCESLNELHLTNTYGISNELIGRIKILEQLKILCIFSMSASLTPLMLKFLAIRCRHLQMFNFKYFTKTEEYFCSTSVYSDYLVSLLQFNKLTLRSLTIDVTELPEQQYVYEYDCTPAVDLLDIIMHNCPLIEHCKLKCFGTLNVFTISQFIKERHTLINISVTKHMYNLARNITYNQTSLIKSAICSDFYDPQINIDKGEANIQNLFDTISDLTHIELNQIWYMSDSLLTTVGFRHYETLLQLTVGRSIERTWSYVGICELLTRCKNLTDLCLSDCSHFTKDNFVKLCDPLNVLMNLRLDNAINLDTHTVVALIIASKRLTIFGFNKCSVTVNVRLIREFCIANNRADLSLRSSDFIAVAVML
jgi:hypothetical protein